LRSNEQRAGRESDPVAEIRQPRRSQQPAETAAKTRWRDDLGEPVDYDRPTSWITMASSRIRPLLNGNPATTEP
jgi:hypothetical protein